MIEEKNISHLKDSKERAGSRPRTTEEIFIDSDRPPSAVRPGASAGGSYAEHKFDDETKSAPKQRPRLRHRVGRKFKDIGGKIEGSEFKMSSNSISDKIIAYPMQSLGFALLVGFLLGIALG